MNEMACADEVRGIVEADETKEMARFEPHYFTRKRSMSFVEILYFMLNPAKESLQTKLNRFFKRIEKNNENNTTILQ